MQIAGVQPGAVEKRPVRGPLNAVYELSALVAAILKSRFVQTESLLLVSIDPQSASKARDGGRSSRYFPSASRGREPCRSPGIIFFLRPAGTGQAPLRWEK